MKEPICPKHTQKILDNHKTNQTKKNNKNSTNSLANGTLDTSSPTSSSSSYLSKSNNMQQIVNLLPSKSPRTMQFSPSPHLIQDQTAISNKNTLANSLIIPMQHSTAQSKLSTNSSFSESNESNEASTLNDSLGSSIENNENLNNSQNVIQKHQAEVALKLQQEMLKKNTEQANLLKNKLVMTQSPLHLIAPIAQQQQQFLYQQQNLLQPNMFNMPMHHHHHQPSMLNAVSCYQNKINSFQADEATRQYKRSQIHFKPY